MKLQTIGTKPFFGVWKHQLKKERQDCVAKDGIPLNLSTTLQIVIKNFSI